MEARLIDEEESSDDQGDSTTYSYQVSVDGEAMELSNIKYIHIMVLY